MAEANFSLEELARHSVTNSLTYRRHLVNIDAQEKAPILIKIAAYCLENSLKIRALGSLREAQRFGARDSNTHRLVGNLAAAVETENPLAALLPDGFKAVHAGSKIYQEFLDSGCFPVQSKPFKTSKVGRALQDVRYSAGRQDISFILLYRDRPLVLARCDIWGDEGITDFDTPVSILSAVGASAKRSAQGTGVAIDVLMALGERYGACNLLLGEGELSAAETVVGRHALARSFLPEIAVSAFIDLQTEDQGIWGGVRKSFRPLIRAQNRQITLRYANDREYHEGLVSEWLRCLGDTAHAVTPDVVWRVVQMAKQGQAEIAGAYLSDGRCCAIIAIIDDGDLSLYYAGHFIDVEGQGKMGHAIVFDAIMRAKARRRRRFYLFRDEIGPTQYVTEGLLGKKAGKWTGVIDFKRGFTGRFDRALAYKKPL